jgi:hypothetical protein
VKTEEGMVGKYGGGLERVGDKNLEKENTEQK